MMTDIDRIKRNIGRMIDKSAPEADIDAYLASEGVTIDQLKGSAPAQAAAPQPQAMPSTMDGFLPPEMQPQQPQGESIGQTFGRVAKGADDLVRIGANAATFGMADRFAGYMGGAGTEAERKVTKEAKDRQGWAGIGAEVAGSALPAVGLLRAGVTSAALMPKLGAVSRIGAAGVDSAALGAAQALGHGEDVGAGALYGGLGGLAGGTGAEVIGSGIKKVAQMFAGKPNIPTTQAIRDTADAAFKRGDDAGVIVAPQAMQRLAADVQRDLTEFGFHPQLQPRVAAAMAEFNRVAQEPVTGKGIGVMRRIAQNAALSADPSERALGGKMVAKLDDFAANLKAGDVLDGDAKTAASAYAEGRKNWAQYRKAETIESALEDGAKRTERTYSGGNIDNATRQEVAKALKGMRGLTADEKAAAALVNSGQEGQDALRLLGRLSPAGGGLMAALQAGAAGASGGATVPIAIGAHLAKMGSDRMTKSNVEALLNVIRAGGDARAAQPQISPIVEALSSPQKRSELARLLALGVGAQQPQPAR